MMRHLNGRREKMKLTDKAAVLEAVLFACGDPVDVERISAATGIEKGAISQLADSLNEAYAENGSSLVVLRLSLRAKV